MNKKYIIQCLNTDEGWDYCVDYTTQSRAVCELKTIRAKWPASSYRLIERTTTDVEVDDGVRYAVQYKWPCGTEYVWAKYNDIRLYRTEQEANASAINEPLQHRLVKITPL